MTAAEVVADQLEGDACNLCVAGGAEVTEFGEPEVEVHHQQRAVAGHLVDGLGDGVAHGPAGRDAALHEGLVEAVARGEGETGARIDLRGGEPQ